MCLCVEIPEAQKFTCTGRDLRSPPTPCQNSLVIYNYSERIVSIGRSFKAYDFCPFSCRRFDQSTISRVQKAFDLYTFSQKITPGHLSFAEECKLQQQVSPTVYTVQLHWITEQWRLKGTLKDHKVQSPCLKHGQLKQVALSQVLNLHDRDPITSFGNLFHYLTTFKIKRFFLC